LVEDLTQAGDLSGAAGDEAIKVVGDPRDDRQYDTPTVGISKIRDRVIKLGTVRMSRLMVDPMTFS
jgi:hypothetical protein